MAGAIAANSPLGVRLTKQAVHQNGDAPSMEAAVELENRNQTMTGCTRDMAEALAAFPERRTPVSTGRWRRR